MNNTQYELMKKLIEKNELDGDYTKIYQLSHAGTDKSGFSIGRTQIDLGGDNKNNREAFTKILSDNGMPKEKVAEINVLLKIQGDKNALNPDLQKSINSILSSDSAKAAIDKLDDAQFKSLEKSVEMSKAAALRNPAIAGNPKAVEYINSDAFALKVADNANQYGDNVRMRGWLQGDKTYKNEKTGEILPFDNPLSTDGKIDDATITDYMAGYKYSQEHTNDFIRRLDNQQEILKAQKSVPTGEMEEKTFGGLKVGGEIENPAAKIDRKIAEQENLQKQKIKLKMKNEPEVSENSRNPFILEKQNEMDEKAFTKKYQETLDFSEVFLAKNPAELTKGEVYEAMDFVKRDVLNPNRKKVDDNVTKYFKSRYPQDSRFATQDPPQRNVLNDAFGKPVEDGVKGIMRKVSEIKNNPNKIGDGVNNLQKALNTFRDDTSKLKEDGWLGSKTSTATFKTVKDFGADKVSTALDTSSEIAANYEKRRRRENEREERATQKKAYEDEIKAKIKAEKKQVKNAYEEEFYVNNQAQYGLNSVLFKKPEDENISSIWN